MLAYRAELRVAAQIATHLSKPESAHQVVQESLFGSEASSVPDPEVGILRVRLLWQSLRSLDESIEPLLAALNAARTGYPPPRSCGWSTSSRTADVGGGLAGRQGRSKPPRSVRARAAQAARVASRCCRKWAPAFSPRYCLARHWGTIVQPDWRQDGMIPCIDAHSGTDSARRGCAAARSPVWGRSRQEWPSARALLPGCLRGTVNGQLPAIAIALWRRLDALCTGRDLTRDGAACVWGRDGGTSWNASTGRAGSTQRGSLPLCPRHPASAATATGNGGTRLTAPALAPCDKQI